MSIRILFTLGVAAIALVAFSTTAIAGDIGIKYHSYYGGSVNVTIGATGGSSGTTMGGGAGMITVQGDNSVPRDDVVDGWAKVFCIEFFEGVNSSWAEYDIVDPELAPEDNGPAGAMGQDGEAVVRELIKDAFQPTSSAWWTKTRSIAYALALWEVVYEYADPAYDGTYTPTLSLSGGYFKVNSAKADAVTLANTWLTALDQDLDLSDPSKAYLGPLWALQNDGGPNSTGLQDYLYVGSKRIIVPLPPAALMGFALLGGLGVAAYRRRRNAA